MTRQPYTAPFDYQSEEVAEAFTEWCTAEGVEARNDQEYRWLRQAFTAGMNETARYSEPAAPRTARVIADVPTDSLRAFAGMAWETYRRDHPAALGITAIRNIARYAPPGKRVRLWIEWEIQADQDQAASDPDPDRPETWAFPEGHPVTGKDVLLAAIEQHGPDFVPGFGPVPGSGFGIDEAGAPESGPSPF